MQRRERSVGSIVRFVIVHWIVVSAERGQDHYEVLGIDRNASSAEIKRAYRAKALVHHPDKAPKGEEEAATARFRGIVEAYQCLSDPQAREQFDRTGPTVHDEPSAASAAYGSGDWWCVWFGECSQSSSTWQAQRESMVPLAVKRAQLRMVQANSLEHLRALALGEDGRLERGMLLAIANANDADCMRVLREEYRYPYPFAGWSKAEWETGFWWEDVLQAYWMHVDPTDENNTAVLRYFDIHGEKLPLIFFARGGRPMESLLRFTYTRAQLHVGAKPALVFPRWVWEQLQTSLAITNRHHSAVQVSECKEFRCEPSKSFVLHQGHATTRDTFISHDFIARELDAEGYSLTHNSTLARYLVVNWTQNLFAITTRCVDGHSDCQQWLQLGRCSESDGFWLAQCRRSCGWCKEIMQSESPGTPGERTEL